MNVGTPELLILAVLVFLVPIYGIYRATRNGDAAWAVAIGVGMLVMFGWAIAAIYLLTVARESTARAEHT